MPAIATPEIIAAGAAVAVTGTAAFAARVRPVHVTVTAPAGRLDPAFRVIVTTSAVYAAVPAAVVGDEIPQPAPAVTCPGGKVRVTLLLVLSAEMRGVEVVKEMVAVPVVPTAELRVKADAATAVTAPTAGTLTNAATVSFHVSIFKPLLAAVYVNPVGVPTVVTTAASDVVVNVNPVTEEPDPVMAETLYVVGEFE